MSSDPKIQSPPINGSWKDIVKFISLVEDPIYSTPVDVEIYQDMYGPILDSLDGKYYDSKVSFFFEISRVNSLILVFRNEEARTFFREEAEELNLIPQLVEICEGETKEEKLKRAQSDMNLIKMKHEKKKNQKDNIKRIQSAENFAESTKKIKPKNSSKMFDSAKNQLSKLTQQYLLLEKSTNSDDLLKKDKLQKKITRIKALIGNDTTHIPPESGDASTQKI